MKLNLFRSQDSSYTGAFREIALQHNVVTSKIFAAIIGSLCFVLCLLDRFTQSGHVLKYPNEYSAAIAFIFVSSCICYLAFMVSKKLNESQRLLAHKLLANLYPLVVVFSSLWITFVMQHNPSNTMAIFVLGMLSVASLWVFERKQAIIISLLIIVLFDSGLHYFQTDPCKLFTNYITGTFVSIFFLCISRISFSVNYNNFMQLKKIEQSRQDIIKINEIQTGILGVVAHDLHAPINNLMSLTNLVMEAESEEEKQEYYELMIDTCSRAKGTINDLLIEARNESGACKFCRTCMNDLIDDTIRKFIKSRNDKQHIIYEAPQEKIYATVDHNKMVRVLENLVGNAIKFTQEEGTITIKMARDSEHLHIFVIDNGIGIPKHLVPYLFKTFSKAGRVGMKGQISYGLGLSICQLIVKQHNGDISASSEEGKGTQMEIILPIAC